MDYITSTSLLATNTLIANGEFTHPWLDKFDLRLSADKTEYGVFVLETLNKSFDNFKDAQQLYIELCQETLGYCSVNFQPTKKTKKTSKLSEIKKEISELLDYGHSELLIWQTIQSSAFNHNDVVKEVLNRLEVKTGLDFSEMNWRKTETWQLVLEMIKEVHGEGVNESLSSEYVGVTGNEVNLTETLANQSQVNYIVVTTDYPQVVIKDDYTAKDLTEVTEDQLSDSLYTDKVTAELMFPGTYYQVLEVNSSNIRQELTEYFNNKFEVIVATETSDNKYKGIPVEHFTTEEYSWHTCMIYTAEQPDNTVFLHNNKQHFYLASKDTFGKGYDYDISMSKKMLPMIKAAKQYLMTEDEKINQAIASNQVHRYAAVLGGQQQKQVSVNAPLPGSVVLSPKHYLKPKLELFAAMTEYVFLMECYLDLITHFNIVGTHKHIREASYNIYSTWCSLTAICFNRYVLMPTIGCNTHTKLLNIWNQSHSA